ncbi:hypothetical protein BEWA_003000 [Theileria equi strain WA]|uniref:Uncharacterized protein n=1 Tax=Theileria equi strain WA TaxID=1537102 RepID=L0AZ95_THEEQ|nr:hypothetical protein BEWA_003000 [Theileria equi strain WA]AFZ80892.1 hypothetical protein BEWA_003000 [Theileria equi strain WA]|eukprot:XP_004830558.1 hypothetical protein BEWA_003000 [Theileria equi strain WA]
MSGRVVYELSLRIKRKCGESGKGCKCPGTNKPGGLNAKREVNPESVVGFVSYTHYSKEEFRLLKDLGGGEELDVGVGHQEIKNVTEVSVYYWDQDNDCRTPLLLKITKQDHPQTVYYKRYKNDEPEAENKPKVWKYYYNPTSISLQALLDERNLGRNNVFPLYLDNPDKPFDLESNATKKVKVESVGGGDSQTLPGTNYTVKEYKLNLQRGTRFSMALFNKNRVDGVKIPEGETTNFRLYFSGRSTVPVALEFKLQNGNSRLLYSTNTTGTQWQEHGSGNDRSYDNYGSQSTEIINKLDGFTCENHNSVTINLTEGVNGNYSSYCCGKHEKEAKKGKDGEAKVRVDQVPVRCKEHNHTSSSIKAYKHTITGINYKLADIRYESGRTRKSVKFTTQQFPLPNVKAVYAFYCSENPVLIYVDSSQDGVTGWYQNGGNSDNNSEQWTKVPDNLNNIAPEKFGDLTCNQWSDLKKGLNKRGTNLEQCSKETVEQLKQSQELRSGDSGELGQKLEGLEERSEKEQKLESEEGAEAEVEEEGNDPAGLTGPVGRDGPPVKKDEGGAIGSAGKEPGLASEGTLPGDGASGTTSRSATVLPPGAPSEPPGHQLLTAKDTSAGSSALWDGPSTRLPCLL